MLLVSVVSLKPHISTGGFTYNDKLAHLFCYFIFTLLAWRITQKNSTFIFVCIGLFFYSWIIEYLQNFTGRFMSFQDLLANGTGIFLGIAFQLYIQYQENNNLRK